MNHIHGPNTPCQIGCPEHPTKRLLPEPDYCDYCGGAVTGAEDEVGCDGWTCRSGDEDDR